jgi:hypothetical protein
VIWAKQRCWRAILAVWVPSVTNEQPTIPLIAEVAALSDGRSVDVAYGGIGGTMPRKTLGLRAPLRHRRPGRGSVPLLMSRNWARAAR